MKFTHALTALGVGVLLIAGCGDRSGDAAKKSVTAPAAATPAASVPAVPVAASAAPAQNASIYDTVAAKGAGFTVGNMMAARVVYVFFDAQCPHCGHLWRASKPVLNQVRMVWMPVRLLADLSERQGAVLLGAADPAAEMDRHEASLNAKQGGLTPPANIPAELAQKVKANTALMSSIGGGAVPYLVYKNPVTGQSAAFEGATDTDGLKKLLGL